MAQNPSGPKFNQAEVQAIRALHAAGAGKEELAVVYGSTPKAIMRVVQRSGWPTRH